MIFSSSQMHKNKPDIMRRAKLLLLLLAFCAPNLTASSLRQPGIDRTFGLSQGALRFYYQASQFRAPGGTWVEIAYSMPYDQVQFVSDGPKFKAAYSFSMIVMDAKGGQVAGDSWDRSLTVERYKELQKGNYLACDTFRLKVNPGKYKFLIICTDGNSERRGESEIRLEVRDFQSVALSLSGLRFQKVQGARLTPWPRRQFGDVNGDINLYYRVYSSGQDSIRASYSLTRFGSAAPAWSQQENLEPAADLGVNKAIKADSLLTGSCVLKLKVEQSGLAATAGESLFIRNSKMINARDYREQVDQLEYISRGRELDSLRQADPATRETLLIRFWQVRDPDTTTSINEYRDEYYERINYANEHFGTMFKSGWKSDMGMIYVLFGPADEIERHPFDMETQAYEVWHYYSDGLRYVFMDRRGIGDYELIYPKREKVLWNAKQKYNRS
jgi:GWxTD domain-containing protein